VISDWILATFGRRGDWRFAEAAVIGSAIVREVEKLAASPDLVNRVGEFARLLLVPRPVSQGTAVRHGVGK